VSEAQGSCVVEPLDVRRHDRQAFSCGRPELDEYLRERAGQDARRKIAAPFVGVVAGTNVVVGYYTLSALSVMVEELPLRIAKRLPPHQGVPVTLLGRLAVDRHEQGRGVGEPLLADALARSLKGSAEVASWAVVVDAIDERARAFYQHFEFGAFPDRPRRLFMPMAAVAKLFG
jgi:GNAT superfamily N-acetyltransferase